jgi:hypothetical protein
MSSRARSIRLLAAALTLLAVLLPPFGYYSWKASQYSRLTRGIGIVQGGSPLLQPSPGLGFAPLPDAATVRQEASSGQSHVFYTDRLGARVNRSGDQTPQRVDLMVVGCSFAWGQGIPNEETFPQILGRELGVSVVNLAFASWGTVQSLRVLETHSDLKPRVVLYAFIHDHMRRNLSPCAPSSVPICLPVPHVVVDAAGPHIEEANMRLFALHRAFAESFFQGRPSLLGGAFLAFRIDLGRLEQRRLRFRGDEGARAASMALLIGRMNEAARAAGAKLIVVSIPYFEPGATWSAPRELQAAIDGLGPDAPLLVDLAPRVAAHNAGPDAAPLGLRPDSVPAHPSAAGHRLIADGVREFFLSHGILADGIGRRASGK